MTQNTAYIVKSIVYFKPHHQRTFWDEIVISFYTDFQTISYYTFWLKVKEENIISVNISIIYGKMIIETSSWRKSVCLNCRSLFKKEIKL